MQSAGEAHRKKFIIQASASQSRRSLLKAVKSGLIFDAATRLWNMKEVKTLQSWIDRCYRQLWSKRSPPLIEMEKLK